MNKPDSNLNRYDADLNRRNSNVKHHDSSLNCHDSNQIHRNSSPTRDDAGVLCHGKILKRLSLECPRAGTRANYLWPEVYGLRTGLNRLFCCVFASSGEMRGDDSDEIMRSPPRGTSYISLETRLLRGSRRAAGVEFVVGQCPARARTGLKSLVTLRCALCA